MWWLLISSSEWFGFILCRFSLLVLGVCEFYCEVVLMVLVVLVSVFSVLYMLMKFFFWICCVVIMLIGVGFLIVVCLMCELVMVIVLRFLVDEFEVCCVLVVRGSRVRIRVWDSRWWCLWMIWVMGGCFLKMWMYGWMVVWYYDGFRCLDWFMIDLGIFFVDWFKLKYSWIMFGMWWCSNSWWYVVNGCWYL